MLTISIAMICCLFIGIGCIATGIVLIKSDIDLVIAFMGWIMICIGVITVLWTVGLINIVV